MSEPSHLPCPMCGKPEKTKEEHIQEEVDQAINNLKFLNLGFMLSYHMTDLERKVYFFYQIRKNTFPEIAEILNKNESTLRKAWNRCKSRGDRVLEESVDTKVLIPPYI
jgi:DNA-directed RNA polymerase specialized sigma24 family protein|tara:strand:+ start:408 stop:734 length:327 start_codon:yes stop_codon:yes gene_type:complete